MNTPLIVTTSWDDGHPSNLRVADMLEKRGLCGTFYVPCVNVEGKPITGAADIEQLGQRVEVGGHTRDHVSLTVPPPQLAENQIRHNKHWLEDLLGREVPGFAYVRGRHDQRVGKLVQQAGFRYARTVRNLVTNSRWCASITGRVRARRRFQGEVVGASPVTVRELDGADGLMMRGKRLHTQQRVYARPEAPPSISGQHSLRCLDRGLTGGCS